MHEQFLSDERPGPNPQLTPADVVQIQLDVLQRNDDPYPDSGIATAFAFASPANRRLSGPLPRFARLVRTVVYRPLLGFDRVGTTPVEQSGDRASQEVTVVDHRGGERVYEFRLARQVAGPYAGCWMVDGVLPLA